MIPTTSTANIRMISENSRVDAADRMMANWAGSWLTIEMKISSDIPLPMPRWVISSPSHITNAVPAVNVITMIATRPGV